MTTSGRRRFGMRASLVRNLIVLVLLTCGAILTVTIVGAYRSVGRLSGALISRATDQTEAQLESFFGLVESEMLVARDWGRSADKAESVATADGGHGGGPQDANGSVTLGVGGHPSAAPPTPHM